MMEALADNLPEGSVIILTATIKPAEAEDIHTRLTGRGLSLIDSPVSGGFPGAQSGTLTMMAAGSDDDMAKSADIMQAVSKTIHHVGDAAPKGQIVKACLQSLIGFYFFCHIRSICSGGKSGCVGSDLV